VEDFADVVHRTLDGQDPPRGSGASISIGAGPGSSRPYAPGGSPETRDLMTAWSWGPVVASEDWDLAAATAPGSSGGPRSQDPVPLAEELPSSCRPCGFDHSAASTMVMVSEVAAM
jgi:hypothetical protein